MVTIAITNGDWGGRWHCLSYTGMRLNWAQKKLGTTSIHEIQKRDLPAEIERWLVVDLPLWKMMEFVSWDDDIPN